MQPNLLDVPNPHIETCYVCALPIAEGTPVCQMMSDDGLTFYAHVPCMAQMQVIEEGPQIVGDGMCQRLARFFLAHRGEWVDGLKLGQHAGSYAWRSRISDLRKAPYFMTVENRQYKRLGADGKKYTVSEYRYV